MRSSTRLGLIAAQDVAHAGRFELEHAAGVALGEDLVGFGIVEREVFEHELDAAVLLDQLERVVDDGERGQAQEVHLEKRELLQPAHVVLGDNFVPVGLVERDQVASAAAGEITTPAACTPALRAMPSRRSATSSTSSTRGSLLAASSKPGSFSMASVELDVERRAGPAW